MYRFGVRFKKSFFDTDLWLNWIEHCTTDAAVRGSNPLRSTPLDFLAFRQPYLQKPLNFGSLFIDRRL